MADEIRRRLALALDVDDLDDARRMAGALAPWIAPGFVTIVPGVRLEGTDTDDQALVGTPAQVAAAGADLLVVGRTVTAAADPEDAARRLHDEVAAALAPRSHV